MLKNRRSWRHLELIVWKNHSLWRLERGRKTHWRLALPLGRNSRPLGRNSRPLGRSCHPLRRNSRPLGCNRRTIEVLGDMQSSFQRSSRQMHRILVGSSCLILRGVLYELFELPRKLELQSLRIAW